MSANRSLGRRRSPEATDPTFVGRQLELQQLKAAFEKAVAGQGALMLLVGEPGIGKTALCEQLASFVGTQGGLPLVGHSYREGFSRRVSKK